MNAPARTAAPARAPATATITELLIRYEDQIAAALPRHLTPERMARLALTVIRSNRRLAEADPISLMGAIIRCSQDGLEPGRTAHLVPFKNGKRSAREKRDVYEVQYIADYRGLIELARRSDQIGRFSAEVVRRGDAFEYERGTSQFLRHRPEAPAGAPVTHVYAVAAAKDERWSDFVVLTTARVQEIRARSRAKDDGPWVTDWEAMAKKTAVRQLAKFLPQSPELQRAVRADELADEGRQNNRSILEGAWEPLDLEPEAEQLEDGRAEASQPASGNARVRGKLKGGAEKREAPQAPEVPAQEENAAQASAEEAQHAADEAPPGPPSAEELVTRCKAARTPQDIVEVEDLGRELPKGAERNRFLDTLADAKRRIG